MAVLCCYILGVICYAVVDNYIFTWEGIYALCFLVFSSVKWRCSWYQLYGVVLRIKEIIHMKVQQGERSGVSTVEIWVIDINMLSSYRSAPRLS